MIYIIPQDKIEKLIFKYLNMMYGDLEQRETKKQYEGIVFKKPNYNSYFNVLAWTKDDETLYIHYKLIDEISSMFSLERNDSEKIIGKWVKDRYKLMVMRTHPIRLDPN